mmetsp:Transcript_87719/g.249561  ORF Transcript_87719/g.249561 Transcript_87719/m.249561 type:complete len:203 (+) Transcript_87719:1036-1644(+)
MITSVATALTKAWSCDTTTKVWPCSPCSVRKRSSHNTPCRSRWLVGSSRRSMSGLMSRATARLRRIRQPPLRVETIALSMVFLKPKPLSTCRAFSTIRSPDSSSSSSSISPSRCAIVTALSSSGSNSSSSLSSTAASSCKSRSRGRNARSSTSSSAVRVVEAALRSCATDATRRCGGKPGRSPDDIRRSSVVFPTPFRPRSA